MLNDRQAVQEYFCWLSGFVCSPSTLRRYQSLFAVLTERAFVSKVYRDDNREVDGLYLRYRFVDDYDGDYNDDFWVGILPEECLILEMLVALALRMEWDFLHDEDIGNRTGVWFWELLDNIGIGDQDDLNFDEDYVQMRINIMLDRTYEPDGTGGLFPLKRNRDHVDQRREELWYQMNHYVSEKIL